MLTTPAALRVLLGSNYEYDYVEGPHPWPAAPGIEALFGKQQMYYSYHNESIESIIEAVNDLADYINETGPYDALMAFSLGAGLAATLLCRNELQKCTEENVSIQKCPTFKCAIFLCGIQPVDWRSLMKGSQERVRVGDTTCTISIPTVHALSPQDAQYFHESTKLLEICEPSKRTEIHHDLGHAVPSRGEELIRLADAIQQSMS